MLRDLILGRELSSLLCIEDNVEQFGCDLLNCFVENLKERVDEVHLLCFEPQTGIINSGEERLQIHNGYLDTFGWQDNSSVLNVYTDLVKYVQHHIKVTTNQKVAIVINSLTPLLVEHGVVKTCQILHALSRWTETSAVNSQIVCLLHSDLHDDNTLSQIRHISSSILKISPSLSVDHYALCDTLHKKSSGKIVKMSEHFNISESLAITDIQEVRPFVTIVTETSHDAPDPTANLTFNLSLSDEEKRARSQLILPYTQAMNRKSAPAISIGQGEGGKIFYQPDDADDFDEEDPDDDLDI